MTANPMSPGERDDDVFDSLMHRLEGWDKAYPERAFSEPTAEERDWLHKTRPGLMDRIAASMGRHMASCIRDDLTKLIEEWNRRAPPDAEAVRDAEDAARAVLQALARQFDEMAQAAEQDGEYSRRDCWRDAASQARARVKHADWIKAAVDAARGALPGVQK